LLEEVNTVRGCVGWQGRVLVLNLFEISTSEAREDERMIGTGKLVISNLDWMAVPS
jgi:hypothetical protein